MRWCEAVSLVLCSLTGFLFGISGIIAMFFHRTKLPEKSGECDKDDITGKTEVFMMYHRC